MRRALQRIQTAAADRWSFVEHPRLIRIMPHQRRDRIGPAFTWMVFGWGMLAIWGSVALGIAIVFITLLGWISE